MEVTASPTCFGPLLPFLAQSHAFLPHPYRPCNQTAGGFRALRLSTNDSGPSMSDGALDSAINTFHDAFATPFASNTEVALVKRAIESGPE